ncbi:MAG: septum formation initiator family protein [Rhodospirillales bacterium]
MNILRELRRRARYIVGPIFGICAVGYFTYHAIHGDRGIIALRQYTQKVEEARAKNEVLTAHRHVLEHRVRLLHPDTLDPDMLEERARVMLNYGYSDEVVVLLEPRPAP